MIRFRVAYLFVFFFLILASCSKDPLLDRMKTIQDIGDSNPQQALLMLDSLDIQVRSQSEYVKNKYDLLKIRLNDKAYITHSSDIVIKNLVKYFEAEGTLLEKQEVNYYAGSVYRDLSDTPRALEHFFKSLEYASNNKTPDSIMICNTYSNLCDLYYKVQDYANAETMARKEWEYSDKLRLDPVLSYMHVAGALLQLEKKKEAADLLDSTYYYILSSPKKESYKSDLYFLLGDYAALNDIKKATLCDSILRIFKNSDLTYSQCLAYADYYLHLNKLDSAIKYCNIIIKRKENNNNIVSKYDASRKLYKIYRYLGNKDSAIHYAGIYVNLSDTLDLGKRQLLAATVSNAYQYHLDKNKEEKLNADNLFYQHLLLIVCVVIVVLLVLSIAVYIHIKRKQIKRVLTLSHEIQLLTEKEQRLRDDIASKEQELSAQIEQNKSIIQQLHQSDFEDSAEDILNTIKLCVVGKQSMTNDIWKRLYKTVDRLHPGFNELLLTELGTFTEQQKQVCYLMRIGLSKPDIQNVTNLSRVTVWRWTKKFEWALG